MQDALNRGLNTSHKAAPGVSKPRNKEGKGKGEKKGKKDRSKTPMR